MLRRLLRRANDAAPEVLSPTLRDRGYARGERILVDGRQVTGVLTGIARRGEDGGERHALAFLLDGARGGVRIGRADGAAALRLGLAVPLRADDDGQAVLDLPGLAQEPLRKPPGDGIDDRALDARVQKALGRWSPARARIVAVGRRTALGMPTLDFDVELELDGGARCADRKHEVPFYAAWLAAPGAEVPVVVDPGDPARAVVDWPAAAREHADRPGALGDPPPAGGVAALLLG
jgi:hypothetical protein